MIDSAIILAGGTGTRLWPASTRESPKQFMDPGTGITLLGEAFHRAIAVGVQSEILVVTDAAHAEAVAAEARKLGPDAPPVTVLAEPLGRNTAPAIAYAAAYLRSRDRLDEFSLVMAADHLIRPLEVFASDVKRAESLAAEGFVVIFGIPPTRAETGYGYIEAGSQHDEGMLCASFREKPEREVAERYAASGNYYWNSGMFVFRNSVFCKELLTYSPEVWESFQQLPGDFVVEPLDGAGLISPSAELQELYHELPKISIDYAVMESSKRAAMVDVRFDWTDLGSWDELAALQREPVTPSEAASAGDLVSGTTTANPAPLYTAEAENNYVLSDMPVALCGVSDLIVVVKNGTVLICNKGESQLVRDIVYKIEVDGREDLL